MGDASFATPKTPRCCGKPRGCTVTGDGCAFLRHPWKRAMLFGEPGPCPCEWMADGVLVRCGLLYGHEGACELDVR